MHQIIPRTGKILRLNIVLFCAPLFYVNDLGVDQFEHGRGSTQRDVRISVYIHKYTHLRKFLEILLGGNCSKFVDIIRIERT